MQLLATDFAVASEDATFSLSEVNWGILPGALVSKVVSDTILPRHALYYCCLGEAFDGKEAERIGMINFAVPGRPGPLQGGAAGREVDGQEPAGPSRNQAGRA